MTVRILTVTHLFSNLDKRMQCQTRTGESVRCLATIGVHIDEVGRHILILRLWPLVTRDIVVRS